MRVLGIADNHDAGAAVVDGGELIAAVGQERLDRIKNSGAFPHEAIDEALRLAGLRPRDVDEVAVGTTFTPAAALRWMRPLHHKVKEQSSQFSYLLHLYILYQVGLQYAQLLPVEKALSAPPLLAALRRHGIYAPLRYVDHHLSHAVSAWSGAGFDRALVITLDAMGDGFSVTVHTGDRHGLTERYRQSGLSSINTLYSRVTEHLGFTPLRHEGKITGLAAYVPPPPELVAHFRTRLRFTTPGFQLENYLRPARKDDDFFGRLSDYSREEVAAALQANFEAEVTAFVSHWVGATGLNQVAVAGGVFANVKLNQRIAQLGDVRRLFVYPNMSDGGLAAGAAMHRGMRPPRALDHVYKGTFIGEAEAQRALGGSGLTVTRPADLEEEVARLLAQGEVVARAAGGMEWGPRALGNRSILYKADDPSVNTWLNAHLRRTEFMPFAPSTLWEGAEARFVGLEKARDAARFMTVCFDVTPAFAAACPGVVHVDGTARPQLVRREDNPAFHEILTRYGALTGEPTVINTSFNMHEEPIVGSAEDAVRAFVDARLDNLALGPLLARGPWGKQR